MSSLDAIGKILGDKEDWGNLLGQNYGSVQRRDAGGMDGLVVGGI